MRASIPRHRARSGTVGLAMVRVELLGELAVQVGGRAIEPPPSRRAWSLLAWLALHPGEHARGSVAAVFWPDVLDASARASLRSAAWALRRALGPAGADALTGGGGRGRPGPGAGPGPPPTGAAPAGPRR